MKTITQLFLASAAGLLLAGGALVQSAAAQQASGDKSGPASSDQSQAEKDYRSLQYGNGKITPEQDAGIRIRAKQLNEAMSDDGTTKPSPTPKPSSTPKTGSASPR